MIPVRSWEDYLALTANEIREYGTGGIQIMRRMRAMTSSMVQTFSAQAIKHLLCLDCFR